MTTRQQMREAAAVFGKEGGKKRAKNMTPEQRKEAARHAVQARWSKAKKKYAPLGNLAAELKKSQKHEKAKVRR